MEWKNRRGAAREQKKGNKVHFTCKQEGWDWATA